MSFSETYGAVERWLARSAVPLTEPPDAAASVERLSRELERLQGALQRVETEMASSTLRAASVGGVVDALLGERERLLQSLGEVILAWRLAGGTVTMVSAEEGTIAAAPPTEGGRAPDSSRPISEAFVLRASPARPLITEMHRQTLRALMGELKKPNPPSNQVEMIDEADTLVEVTQRERIDQWRTLPNEMQRTWLTMLVARARAITEAAQAMPGTRSKLQAVFPKLSAYSKEYQPGYVHGLAVGHLPTRGTWLSDALHAWEELAKMAEGR